jgi:hypothetical protein
MRRVVLLVALLLLAAACGSTSRSRTVGDAAASTASASDAPSTFGSATSSSRPGESGAGTSVSTGGGSISASARPGAATSGGSSGAAASQTGPLEIGFLNTKVGNAAAAGLNTGETYTPAEVFRALANAMNDRGGLAGRKIVPVVADTDTATARWETDYQAACATFTEDHHVSAVLGYSFAMMESFESCLTKAGVSHLSGGYAMGDEKTLDDYPHLFATTNPTVDRRYLVQLDGAVKSGFLKKTHRLGLVLDDCPPDARAYTRTVAPYITKAGLNVVAKSVLSCPDGASDAGPLVQQLNNAVLQFRSANVDRVFVEGIPFIFFANTAEGQGWHPGYLLTSATAGAVLEANNIPERQLENIFASGWLPYLDVSPSKQPAHTPPQQRCLSLLKGKGVIPSQYSDYVTAYTTCDAMFLYERALKATHGVSAAKVVTSAIEALGTSYAGATAHNAKTGFGADDHDAVSLYRPWTWKRDCDCFLYIGGPRPLP